jgi:cytochrome c peroxidase
LAGKALAVYLRVAVSRDAPFDRWNAGDDAAMSPAAVRGLTLFLTRAKCSVCHSGPLFSDFLFHNVSTSPPDATGARADEGRFRVTGDEADRGAFLTPMLRHVSNISPYLHDGSETTLAAVIRHLTGEAGRVDPLHDRLLDSMPTLSADEVDDLVQFLKALKGQPLPAADLAGADPLP